MSGTASMCFKSLVGIAMLALLTAPALPARGVRAQPRPAAAAPAQASAPHRPTPAPSKPSFEVKAVLLPDRPIRAGDFIWNEDEAPSGPTSIVVDLTQRLLFVYRGGYEIGRSSIIYGATGRPTPTGKFRILQKDAKHVSNLYDAPMPFMLRLTMDGITIHASEVSDLWGTHGCVGLPKPFAKLLFGVARLGDPVLITPKWHQQLYADPGADVPVRYML